VRRRAPVRDDLRNLRHTTSIRTGCEHRRHL
jgi:hypothetical protein